MYSPILCFVSLVISGMTLEGHEESGNRLSSQDLSCFFGISKYLAKDSRLTGIFSPLGAYEMYTLISCYKEDVALEFIEIHKSITDNILKLDKRDISISSGFMETDDRGNEVLDSKCSPLFKKMLWHSNHHETIFEKYQDWIKESVSVSPTKNNHKVTKFEDKRFLSYVYFNSERFISFEKNKAKSKFTYQDGSSSFLDYKCRSGKIQRDKISLNGVKDVEIVILPCERESEDYRRCLVYLIPETFDYNLNELWHAFEECTKSNLEQFIERLPFEYINFYIPELIRSATDVNLADILPPGTLEYESTVSMITFFDVREDQKELTGETHCTSEHPCNDSITVDRSYLSFVYDYDLHSILLFMNYTGRYQ